MGMAQAAVAAKAGVSKASVRRIERETPVTTSEPKAMGRQHRVGRPSIATPWARAARKTAKEVHELAQAIVRARKGSP